jgi:hypothetical protein
MNVSVWRMSSIVLLAIVVVAVIAGCAEIRKLTYPESFVYLDKKEVESLMQSMSDDIVRLNQLVSEASETDTVQQQKIVAELSSIERTAIRLSGGHKQTNQFFIGDHIEDFIDDVGTAKMFARSNPPRYDKAREITSACQECHQFH